MLTEVLLPETIAHQDGMGKVLEIDSGKAAWLLTLSISRILEHESLELVVSGSPDSEHWLPVAKFPRKFYCGTYSQWLDLSTHPGVRYLRADWKISRWGLAEDNVLCTFNLSVRPGKVMHAGA